MQLYHSALLPESQIYILDRSSATLEAIKESVDPERIHLVLYDAEEPLPQDMIGIADMVFFDQPWYWITMTFQRGFKIKGWRAIWKIEEIFESIQREYPDAVIPESEKPAVEKVWRELRSHLGD